MPTYECELCKYTCAQKGSLKRHVTSVHEIKKPFKCDHCDSKFSLNHQLNGHIALVHEKEKLFKCKL